MVLDDPVEIDLLKRLQRGDIMMCLRPLEKAEVVFEGGQSRIFYVGGILRGDIVYSHGVDVSGVLQSPLQRLPMSAVRIYRVMN